ncbi:hypothetical protein LUTEI9C_100185 [Luteimonas sp. 9C]|nr:hypothetical protein LUTEI9C_100185 [Luteimonas sp. 9C]
MRTRHVRRVPAAHSKTPAERAGVSRHIEVRALRSTATQHRDHRQNQEHDEENPGDVGGGACDTTEAEDTGDDGDDKKDNGITKHGWSPDSRERFGGHPMPAGVAIR